jgi:hypothetical protein
MDNILERLEKLFGKYPFLVIFTNSFAIAFCVSIGYLCFYTSPTPIEQVFNCLIALLGLLLGWALGMFFAPYTDEDAARFSSIGQAVSVFVSGYALSKLDRFLEATMFIKEGPVAITWIRIGLLICATLVSVLTVFSNRSYFRHESDKPKTNKMMATK